MDRLTRRLTLTASVLMAGAMCFTPQGVQGQPAPRQGMGYHRVELPRQPAAQKETRILLETPHLKVLAISLPRGNRLPPHSDPSPVWMQVLSGAGTLNVEGRDEDLTVRDAIYLAPGIEHSVAAAEKEDLLLLIEKPVQVTPRGPGFRRRSPGR